MAQATQVEMNRFVKVVDEFMQKYALLVLPQTRADVYASGDPQLISDYETAISRGGLLKANIEGVTGAWAAAKSAYASVTDVTSVVIGDVIDWFKNLFGGNQGVSGLGVIQIPAAAWIITSIGIAGALILSMDRIFIMIEANKIQQQNPTIPRDKAIDLAKGSIGLDIFGDAKAMVMVAGIAFLAWMFLGQKK